MRPATSGVRDSAGVIGGLGSTSHILSFVPQGRQLGIRTRRGHGYADGIRGDDWGSSYNLNPYTENVGHRERPILTGFGLIASPYISYWC